MTPPHPRCGVVVVSQSDPIGPTAVSLTVRTVRGAYAECCYRCVQLGSWHSLRVFRSLMPDQVPTACGREVAPLLLASKRSLTRVRAPVGDQVTVLCRRIVAARPRAHIRLFSSVHPSVSLHMPTACSFVAAAWPTARVDFALPLRPPSSPGAFHRWFLHRQRVRSRHCR